MKSTNHSPTLSLFALFVCAAALAVSTSLHATTLANLARRREKAGR